MVKEVTVGLDPLDLAEIGQRKEGCSISACASSSPRERYVEEAAQGAKWMDSVNE